MPKRRRIRLRRSVLSLHSALRAHDKLEKSCSRESFVEARTSVYSMSFYLLVTTERCTFMARSIAVRRNMKMKLAVAFAVLLFAGTVHADEIFTGTGELTIPDGSTVTSILFIPYPDGIEWNNAYQVTFTMPDMTGTVEGNSLLGYWATLDFAVPASDISFDWLASSVFYATDNLGDIVGNGCEGCTGTGFFAGPGITQIYWQAGDEEGGIESISYTLDPTDPPQSAPEPSSLLLAGMGLAALICAGASHSYEGSEGDGLDGDSYTCCPRSAATR